MQIEQRSPSDEGDSNDMEPPVESRANLGQRMLDWWQLNRPRPFKIDESSGPVKTLRELHFENPEHLESIIRDLLPTLQRIRIYGLIQTFILMLTTPLMVLLLYIAAVFWTDYDGYTSLSWLYTRVPVEPSYQEAVRAGDGPMLLVVTEGTTLGLRDTGAATIIDEFDDDLGPLMGMIILGALFAPIFLSFILRWGDPRATMVDRAYAMTAPFVPFFMLVFLMQQETRILELDTQWILWYSLMLISAYFTALIALFIAAGMIVFLILFDISERYWRMRHPQVVLANNFMYALRLLCQEDRSLTKIGTKKMLLYYFIDSARIIAKDLPKAMHRGEPTLDTWYRNRCQQQATAIRNLNKAVLNPMAGTKAYLEDRILLYLNILQTGDLDRLPRPTQEELEEDAALRPQVRQYALRRFLPVVPFLVFVGWQFLSVNPLTGPIAESLEYVSLLVIINALLKFSGTQGEALANLDIPFASRGSTKA